MREYPILFSGQMVKALLDGRKTQTRRVMKGQLKFSDAGVWYQRKPNKANVGIMLPHESFQESIIQDSPYGQIGDRLWVRETWRIEDRGPIGNLLFFAADSGSPCGLLTDDRGIKYAKRSTKYRPSIHMPRWASRINLEITDVRVQKLNEISEGDAKAEGVGPWPHGEVLTPNRNSFIELWESINGRREGCTWNDNPWVWAISFKRLHAIPTPLPVER